MRGACESLNHCFSLFSQSVSSATFAIPLWGGGIPDLDEKNDTFDEVVTGGVL